MLTYELNLEVYCSACGADLTMQKFGKPEFNWHARMLTIGPCERCCASWENQANANAEEDSVKVLNLQEEVSYLRDLVARITQERSALERQLIWEREGANQ